MNRFDDKTRESILLHVAGASKQHKSQFSDLKIIENSADLEQAFITRYVVPFYLGRKDSEKFKEGFSAIKGDIDGALVEKLLGDLNWRSRSVGAYFTATHNLVELEQNIGHLLLRSDVCYAGHTYCLALASFATEQSICYLNQYLQYYLEQPDLFYDQQSAMAALAYIGANSGKDLVTPHMESWQRFIANKPNWDLASSIDNFSEQMQILNEYKLQINP